MPMCMWDNPPPVFRLIGSGHPCSRARHHLHPGSLQSRAVGSRCRFHLGQPKVRSSPHRPAASVQWADRPCQPAPQSAPNMDPADEVEERLQNPRVSPLHCPALQSFCFPAPLLRPRQLQLHRSPPPSQRSSLGHLLSRHPGQV